MIAYNHEWLDHLIAREDVEELFDEGCITKEEQRTILAKYPVAFYTPNIFTRIGLFILTLIILLFSFGLLVLMFLNSVEKMYGVLLIFFAIVVYIALELMVLAKKHYRSGVDDALLWGFACALFAGFSLPNNFSDLSNCMLIFLISSYGCLRFADRLMGVAAYLSMLGILFYTMVELGSAAKAIVPFMLMGVSILVYAIVKKIQMKKITRHYSACLNLIGIVSLITLYVTGNYYVVRELSNSMFHLNLQVGQSIPFGWLFWAFTITIPILYIARGIQKKDAVLIRTGLLMVAAIVFTIRYYHSIMPVEILMTLAGIVLLVIGYGLVKYLHEPKYGFTYREISKKNAMDKLNVESLVIAETFAPGAEPDGTKFGGGSFGGGGTSGDY